MKEEFDTLNVRVTDIDKSLGEVKALMASRDSKSETLYKKVDEIYECLIGSTEPAKPSVMMRIDRLEQLRENTKWVWVAVGGLMLNAAWEWLRHG